MFLIGLFSLAAVGGAAYAISDVFDTDPVEDTDEDVSEDGTAPEETADGADGPDLLTSTEDSETAAFQDQAHPSTGTVLSNYGGNQVIAGTDGQDALTGQDGHDQINGYGGNDSILGGAGNDVLYGGDGADYMAGNGGDDILHGEAGDDRLEGAAGADALYGHFGQDQLDGGDGADRLYGGQGQDLLSGGAGDDALHGGYGDDWLSGGAGQDVMFGGYGNDVLSGDDGDGQSAADFLNGGAGNDTILADGGDIVTGGDGQDEIILNPALDDQTVSVMDFQPGQDRLLISWEGPENPDIHLQQDTENESLTNVLINGQNVAQLLGAGDITLADIELVSGDELTRFNTT